MKSLLHVLIVVSIYALNSHFGYGQRVYADAQSSQSSLLSSVSDQGYAIDSDNTNYSTLNSVLGLLGIGYAMQNLEFTGTLKPAPTAPLMIRFGSGGSILGLFDGIQIQRTNGGISNTVGANYSSDDILGLLTLNADPNPKEVTVPVPGIRSDSDGLRLRISSVLGLGFSTNLYYAFFITPPTVESPVYVCEAENALISISNYQPGYTYSVYDALTGGNLLATGDLDVLTLSTVGLTSGEYYIEAIEGDTEFTSSRTPFNIVIYPKPGNPEIDLSNILN